jgi:prepilin-type N-terminal cleavage/methylation domain-containing protein
MSDPVLARLLGIRAGFTLIELLVVISIIAILAGMVLSGVGLVRDQARQMRCQSSQRQLALASMAYAHDQEGVLPDANLANSVYWTVLTYDYLDQAVKPLNGTAYTSGNFYQSCPEFDRTRTGCGFAINAQLRFGEGGTANSLHNCYVFSTSNWTAFTLAGLSKPSGRLYVSDSYINPISANLVYRNYVLPNTDSPALLQTGLRHRNKMMGIFLDGHAGVIRATDLSAAFRGDL